MSAITLWEGLDRLGFSAAQFSLGLLWQSSLLFLAIVLIARVLRKRSPSVRHFLWVGALFLADDRTSSRSAHIWSCSPAAARKVSQAAIITLVPAFL